MSIQQQNTSIQKHQTLIQQQQVLIKQHEHTVKQLQGSIISIQSYAGGGYYGEPGSAAEYVCLPPDPNYVKTSGPDGAFMYGGEFDTKCFAYDNDNEDVPCALYRAAQATSVLMIPGKYTCYSDWKEKYYGYLASGGYSEASASEFVCVNINSEHIVGGVDERYGKLFYEVLTKCGSLKCPPYKEKYPLTCVVCSK